jgi:hypothetical protein
MHSTFATEAPWTSVEAALEHGANMFADLKHNMGSTLIRSGFSVEPMGL